MQRYSFPIIKYLVPGALLLISGAWFAAQQHFQSQKWWADVPWGQISLLLVAFIIGTLYADICNKTSQLRRWWSYRNRICEFDVFSRAKNDTEKQWFELVIRAKFLKDETNVSVELFAYDAVQFSLVRAPSKIIEIPLKNYSGDEALEIIAACIPQYLRADEPRRHTLWGSQPGENALPDGAKLIAPASDNLAEIRIKRGRKTETFRVFFALMNRRSDTGESFFFLPETRDVTFRQNG